MAGAGAAVGGIVGGIGGQIYQPFGERSISNAQLEDQIAVLDGHLSQLGDSGSADAQLVDLWRQRVGLMQQLVQVHITRAKYVGL